MRLFLEIARRSLSRHLTYRAAALAGLVTNVFFGLLRVAVLLALYGAQTSVAGYSVQDAVTYAALTQALIVYLAVFGWFDLMQTVHSGEVAADLLRPLDVFRLWLARDAGRSVAALLLRGLPVVVTFSLLFDLARPTGAAQWAAVAVAMALSWIVGFAWRFLVNLAAFWSPDAVGIGRLAFFAALFLTGFLMPLNYFPDWVGVAASFTPFPSMLDTVIEVYLGVVRGPEMLRLLAQQAAWAVALVLACRLVLRAAVRRLVVLGG